MKRLIAMGKFGRISPLGPIRTLFQKRTTNSGASKPPFPVLVWTERFRVSAILALAAFQIGIAVLLSGVQCFSLSMLNAVVLFLPSAKTYLFWIRIWTKLGRFIDVRRGRRMLF